MSIPQSQRRSLSRSLSIVLLLAILLVILLPSARSSAQIGPDVADGPAATAAPAILVFADDPLHRPPESYVDIALRELGYEYEAVYDDMARFEEALYSRRWDLVIMANDRVEPTKSVFEGLDEYVRNRGRLIIHTWFMAEVPDAPLWETLGVKWVDTAVVPFGEKAAPLHWWQPKHPIFNEPNAEVPEFLEMSNEWGDVKSWPVEHRVAPARGVEPLAGFTREPTEEASGLIISNYGVTVFRGFVDFINNADLDQDKVPDAVQLWQNLIYYVLTVDPQPASFGKIAPSNNSTDVEPNPLLDWASSARASRYSYCIDQSDNSICDSTWRTTTSSSAIVTGLAPDTDYFWQVRAENPYGTTTANSGVWWKVTTTPLPGTTIHLPMVTMGQSCATFPSPREIESNDIPADANGHLCLGYSFVGNPDDGDEDQDWFKFNWSGQGTLTIDVTNYLYDAQVILYNGSITELDKDYWQLDGHYELSYSGPAAAGTYYLLVFAPQGHPTGNGDYTLTVYVQ